MDRYVALGCMGVVVTCMLVATAIVLSALAISGISGAVVP